MIWSNIFQFAKGKYIFSKKDQVACILCATIEKNPAVPSLEVVRTDLFAVAINLYPYNTGHLMIYPLRHVTDYRQLEEREQLQLAKLTSFFLEVLDQLYQPKGFNVGYNLGEHAGASIAHIHQHIIPRYSNELGVVDLIGGAKVIIEDPNDTMTKVRAKALSLNSPVPLY